MLKIAQINVGRHQFGHRRRRQQVALCNQRQHLQRVHRAQCVVLPATHQLKQLRSEFDLADAAGAEFDVVLHVAPLDFAAHLLVQVAQRFEGAVIEVAPEHEMPGEFGEFGGAVAAQHAALDPGVALPLAPLRDEVIFEHGEAAGERPVGTERP